MPFEQENKHHYGLKAALIIIVLAACAALTLFAFSVGNAACAESDTVQLQSSVPEPTPPLGQAAYETAVELMDLGLYDEAIVIFEGLAGYADSEDMIARCLEMQIDVRYESACALFEDGAFSEAREAFLALGDYKDCPQLAADCEKCITRDSAVALMNSGDYENAVTVLESLGNFMDCPQLIDRCRYEMLEIGESIVIGSYEQDNKADNGPEPIEWFILDKQDGKVLVLSRYALEVRLYHFQNAEVTWETCTMREWLNGDFYNNAFTDEERALIPLSTVTADPNPMFKTPTGNDTEDYVFLLSIDEAERYFEKDSARVCEPTAHARARGAGVYQGKSVWWWLRSPGMDNRDGALVGVVGQINCVGFFEIEFGYCARPAMWVQICEG